MQNQLQLHSPKTRFPQEVPVPAENSSGIPHSNPQVLCFLWLLQLSTFFYSLLEMLSQQINLLQSTLCSNFLPQKSWNSPTFAATGAVHSQTETFESLQENTNFQAAPEPFLAVVSGVKLVKNNMQGVKGLVK